MALTHCSDCGDLLREGDRVKFRGTSTYHVLKATAISALDKFDFQVVAGSLKHVRCPILGPDPDEN